MDSAESDDAVLRWFTSQPFFHALNANASQGKTPLHHSHHLSCALQEGAMHMQSYGSSESAASELCQAVLACTQALSATERQRVLFSLTGCMLTALRSHVHHMQPEVALAVSAKLLPALAAARGVSAETGLPELWPMDMYRVALQPVGVLNSDDWIDGWLDAERLFVLAADAGRLGVPSWGGDGIFVEIDKWLVSVWHWRPPARKGCLN